MLTPLAGFEGEGKTRERHRRSPRVAKGVALGVATDPQCVGVTARQLCMVVEPVALKLRRDSVGKRRRQKTSLIIESPSWFRGRQKAVLGPPKEVVMSNMSNTSVHGAVDKATDSKAFEYTARVGFAASGVLHLIVAFIILRLAFGSGGNADQSGALGYPRQATRRRPHAVGRRRRVGRAWSLAPRRSDCRLASPASGPDDSRRKTRLPGSARSPRARDPEFAIAFSAARFAMGSGQSSGQQNSGMSAQLMQSGWERRY